MYPTATPPLVLNERVPDPALKNLDPSFEQYRVPLASVERLSQGYSWAEGPVYFGDARCLLWSDIPNNRIMRWDEETGATSIYRKPSNYANGNTRDRQGRLVTAEHGRRVTRTEYDGRITVLMDRFDGKRLNSPNDIVVKSDDSIWFTDMNAGITGNWNGEAAELEMPQRVYRIDSKSGQPTIVTDGLVQRPNGLAFSPDEKKLYVIESQPGERAIYVFDVADGTKLTNGRKLIVLRQGRNAGRLPRRRRRQSVVRLGHGHARTRRRPHLQSARRPDRPHQPAGARRQRLLRRAQAQPPVHGGVPFGLCALCEHPRRPGRLRFSAAGSVRISSKSSGRPTAFYLRKRHHADYQTRHAGRSKHRRCVSCIDPHGARRLGAERAISRSRRPDSRPELCEISHRSGHGRAHRHGLPLE